MLMDLMNLKAHFKVREKNELTYIKTFKEQCERIREEYY